MSRRTYQQAQAWRAAAVALLAEVGVEIRPTEPAQVTVEHPSPRWLVETGKATLVVYLTGSVSIGGPGPDADYLCEPLERHGLLNGWHPGSRGSGVVWVPQPVQGPSPPRSAEADIVARLRSWRDELAASGKPYEIGPWIARELDRRFPEVGS